MPTVVASHASIHTCLKLVTTLVLAIVGFQGQAFVYGQSGDNVVAMVNGRKITQLEVDKSVIAKLGPLQQQIYDLRKTALDNLILRFVLEDEAKKRRISIDDLKRELTAVKVEVPQSDIEQSYAENLSAFGNMSPDEARERLRLDFESKARMRNYRETLSKLRESSHVTSTLDEPLLPIGNTFDNAPIRGGHAAAVTIVEFSDFQCPYCKAAQGTLSKILRTYGDRVRFVFKHLPLQIHADAFAAAKAAICAGEQGKFWNYHDALFASDSLVSDALSRMAVALNLDSQKFQDCLGSPATDSAVLKDMQDAQELGINGTPTFIVNGTLYRGALSFEDFSGIIENKLTLSKTPLPPQ